jgi:hypothetical protein
MITLTSHWDPFPFFANVGSRLSWKNKAPSPKGLYKNSSVSQASLTGMKLKFMSILSSA